MEKYPKIYWKRRGEKNATLFLGNGKRGDLCFQALSFGFKKENSCWKDFPEKLTIYPEEQRPAPALPFAPLPCAAQRVDCPTHAEWLKNASKAIATMQSSSLRKLVLARRTTFVFQNPLNPWHLLSALEKTNAHGTLFCMELSPNRAFLGITPEMLYVRDGRTIHTEALAGTSTTREGLFSPKIDGEFGWIPHFLKERLSPLCTHLVPERECVLQTAHLFHRHQPFVGELKPDISDVELLKILHPTPAVGGYPDPQWQSALDTLEPFDRGWYAAPIGWTTPSHAEFAVALRCAQVEGPLLHLYAGVGIVKDSDPHQEWEELEQKIRLFVRMLKS